MPRNIGTLDGGQDVRRKRNWGKGQRQEGKLEDNEGGKKNTAGFITLLGFGPVHVDWLTVLGHIHIFTFSCPYPFFPFPFLCLSKSVLKPLGVARQGMCMCKGASLPEESEPKVERRISLGVGWEGG